MFNEAESLAEYLEKFMEDYISCLEVDPYQIYQFYTMDAKYINRDGNFRMELCNVKTGQEEIRNLFVELNLFREIKLGDVYIHTSETEVKEDDASYYIRNSYQKIQFSADILS